MTETIFFVHNLLFNLKKVKMRTFIFPLLLLALQLAAVPLAAQTQAPPASSNAEEKSSNDFNHIRYQVDYEVNADASSTRLESHEILLKTTAAVQGFSQVRLEYSDTMQALDVLSAYTLTADGQRHDVSPEKIYTQESYSSAASPVHADNKVRVIVFPNLAPGARIVYQQRLTQKTPRFPGLFDMWETFSLFAQYDDVEINLHAPADLPINVFNRGLAGSNTPQIHDGRAHWRWHYQGKKPLKMQSISAPDWTFSPTLMASTYSKWSQLAKAYQAKAKQAAQVTPAIQALAEQITSGIADRRAQAQAIYHWVAKNIRYVAVYLGNGSLEPRSAQSIIDSLYGDCKDHVAVLEALLAAMGIESSPALIGVGNGPLLASVPMLSQFNHVITYLPEFDLYLESTTPWARFGQLPEMDRGLPVLHTLDAKLARTPPSDHLNNHSSTSVDFVFDRFGNLHGQTQMKPSEDAEINLRNYLSQINEQNRAAAEQSFMAAANMHGKGRMEMHSELFDFSRPLDYRYTFQSEDYVDFNVFGGMTLPLPPGSSSFRDIYSRTMASSIKTPFECQASHIAETYRFQLPDDVPVIAIPNKHHFRNAAGEYQVEWQQQGQQISVTHQLQRNAMRGADALCQAQDYPLYRELFQQVRRGFRTQVIYGKLPKTAVRAKR